MKPESDLFLLKEQLIVLSQSPFYNSNIGLYIASLGQFVDFLLSQKNNIPDVIFRKITSSIWKAYHHLNGTTSRDVPYEIIFCLELALEKWQKAGINFIIATELLNDKEFYFRNLYKLQDLQKVLPGYTPALPFIDIIYIALPRIYKNTPLNCTPLYHELGHFVDTYYGGISKRALLIYENKLPAAAPIDLSPLVSHYREYFADIFAASFIGNAMAKSLKAIAPNSKDCDTHPATHKRIELIENFLAGKSDNVLSHFNEALTVTGLPSLKPCPSGINVENSFNDRRPLILSQHDSIHDLFDASWQYLEKNSDYKFIKLANDLVEKTIRSYSIKRTWNNAAALQG